MLQPEFEKVIKAVVNEKPTIVYKRIQKMWPREFPIMGNNYETTDGSKADMVKFLIKKGVASGHFENFLKSL